MTRITARASIKMTIPGIAYSSQEFSVEESVEIEATDEPAIQQERRKLFARLRAAVMEQHAIPTVPQAPATPLQIDFGDVPPPVEQPAPVVPQRPCSHDYRDQ